MFGLPSLSFFLRSKKRLPSAWPCSLRTRLALARVVVADARAEGAARDAHHADVMGRVELGSSLPTSTDAVAHDVKRLADDRHGEVAQPSAKPMVMVRSA